MYLKNIFPYILKNLFPDIFFNNIFVARQNIGVKAFRWMYELIYGPIRPHFLVLRLKKWDKAVAR